MATANETADRPVAAGELSSSSSETSEGARNAEGTDTSAAEGASTSHVTTPEDETPRNAIAGSSGGNNDGGAPGKPPPRALTEARYRARHLRREHDIWRAMDAIRGTTAAILQHAADPIPSIPEEPTPDSAGWEYPLPHGEADASPVAIAWTLESVVALRRNNNIIGPRAHLRACAGSVIAVAGPIGAGKSTVCISLERLFLREGVPAVVLPEEIPLELLGKFIAYAARAREGGAASTPNPYAYPLQMYMLERCISRARRSVDLAKRGLVVIVDRCLHENLAFSQLQYDTGNLTSEQWGIYRACMNAATTSIPPPDIILLLNVAPDVALARCHGRARTGEGGYDLSYFEALARAYAAVFYACGLPRPDQPVLTVTVDWSEEHPIDTDSGCLVGDAPEKLVRIISNALCAASQEEGVASRLAIIPPAMPQDEARRAPPEALPRASLSAARTRRGGEVAEDRKGNGRGGEKDESATTSTGCVLQ